MIAALIVSLPVCSQGYPEKTVRMLVPFPPGGPLDLVARVFAVKLGERFGQSFLVENGAGAGGSIGMDTVARAAPDGHLLLWALDSMLTVNPVLYKQFGEPLERLRPVTLLTESLTGLVLHPSLNVRSPVELAKLSNTRDLSYASAGVGSPGHRSMEYFMLATGAKMTHVPYKGNAPAIQSLVSGETQVFMTPIAGALPHVRAGRLRVLAVTSEKRSADVPDVPTMIEAGFPDFTVMAWYAVMAPAKTPQAVVDTLDRELVRIMKQEDVQARLKNAGLDPVFDTAASVIARSARERKLWTRVIEKSGMKAE